MLGQPVPYLRHQLVEQHVLLTQLRGRGRMHCWVLTMELAWSVHMSVPRASGEVGLCFELCDLGCTTSPCRESSG
jgi:hypothetical protein